MLLRWLPLLALLLGSCPGAAGTGEPGTSSAELAWAGGRLTLLQDGVMQGSVTCETPQPYAIVAPGPPALVTTCTAALEPVTYAAGAVLRAYPGTFPLVCAPPLVALLPLPDLTTYLPAGCILLKPDGNVLWQGQGCELLEPAAGAADSGVAYIAQGLDGTALTPFGFPSLVAVNLQTGAELWRRELQAQAEAVDVQLIALGEAQGLLSLQYSYEAFEYITFERAAGALGPRHMLTGQPASRQVYPGPSEELAGVETDGGEVRLLVYPLAAEPQVWRITLASGVLRQEAYTGERPATRREENPLPVGGAGAPDLAAPPFPQALLPTAAGEQWRIPALLDEQGRVFVVDDQGARWARAVPEA